MNFTANDVIESAKASKGGSSDAIHDGVLKIIKSKGSTTGSLLDLGMGQGTFLKKVQIALPSLDCFGSDAADYGIPDGLKLEKHYIGDFNQKLEIDRQFDIVCAIEVIEHLRDPRHFISQLEDITKVGGTIIVTTPNNESITSLISFIFRGYFTAFSPNNYPAHITPLTEYHLKQMIRETKSLRLEQVHYFNNGRIPGSGAKWHSLIPFLRGKRFSDNFVLVIKKN
tara:strand:+ start:1541 stop:2218 length:678 start_codon:yes stop_codon:yes gene_type:complete